MTDHGDGTYTTTLTASTPRATRPSPRPTRDATPQAHATLAETPGPGDQVAVQLVPELDPGQRQLDQHGYGDRKTSNGNRSVDGDTVTFSATNGVTHGRSRPGDGTYTTLDQLDPARAVDNHGTDSTITSPETRH